MIQEAEKQNPYNLCRAWEQETFPNTQKSPVDLDSDLDIDLGDKLDDKALQLSQQFSIPRSKVKQIILSLVDQALDNKDQKESQLPY